MRVVIAHVADGDILDVRRSIAGAGLECTAGDCVSWQELPLRLAQVEASLVVLISPRFGAAETKIIQEARSLSGAPIIAIGPSGADNERTARAAGAGTYIQAANLRPSLDMVIESLVATDSSPRQRGQLIPVVAPATGSGGTFVATNLAGSLAAKHPRQVALVELAVDHGDLAHLIEAPPPHRLPDLCQRWSSLDAAMIRDCVVEHKSGLLLLLNPEDQSGNEHLHVNSVRKFAVLSRLAFPLTLFALDSRISEVEMEAMRLSDVVVLVVRADVPALRRVKWFLHHLEEWGVAAERMMLVVNRWGQGGLLKKGEIEETLDNMPIAQLIPDDASRANQSVNRGVLMQELASRSAIGRSFTNLADSLSKKFSMFSSRGR